MSWRRRSSDDSQAGDKAELDAVQGLGQAMVACDFEVCDKQDIAIVTTSLESKAM